MRALAVLLLAVVPALAAQNPGDTTSAATGQLRQQFRERWNERVRTQLGLTADQSAQLQATEDRFAAQRRTIVQRQRGVQEALRAEVQPGGTANADSVRRLMDVRDQNRAAMGQLERDEDREMARYLTPVQRARYQLMRQRLQERIAEVRRQRRQQLARPRATPGPGGGAGGGGARKRPRP
jgi:protein CpxP